MERLTQHGFDYCAEYCVNSADCGFFKHDVATPCADAAIYNRLAAYEDTGLEPQTLSEILDSVSEWYDAHKEGRLVVLPCKVGDTVCCLNPFDEIENGKITMIQQKADGTWKFRVTTSFSHDVTIDAIGKTVFLAREEAEAKLEEREDNG